MPERAPFETDPAIPEHQAHLGFDLAGKTLGVVGLGSIGTRVAQLGQAFDMKVIAWNRSQKTLAGVRQVSI